LDRWYFYQKTKNYRVIYSGVLGGLKTGTRLAVWTGAFVALEEGFELGLARYIVPAVTDDGGVPFKTRWASGAVAGLGLAGAAGQICEYLRRYQPESKLLTSSRLFRPTVAVWRRPPARARRVPRRGRWWSARSEGLDACKAAGEQRPVGSASLPCEQSQRYACEGEPPPTRELLPPLGIRSHGLSPLHRQCLYMNGFRQAGMQKHALGPGRSSMGRRAQAVWLVGLVELVVGAPS
jgi:hypothetical protein